jgi:hypothetical protein
MNVLRMDQINSWLYILIIYRRLQAMNMLCMDLINSRSCASLTTICWEMWWLTNHPILVPGDCSTARKTLLSTLTLLQFRSLRAYHWAAEISCDLDATIRADNFQSTDVQWLPCHALLLCTVILHISSFSEYCAFSTFVYRNEHWREQ